MEHTTKLIGELENAAKAIGEEVWKDFGNMSSKDIQVMLMVMKVIDETAKALEEYMNVIKDQSEKLDLLIAKMNGLK